MSKETKNRADLEGQIDEPKAPVEEPVVRPFSFPERCVTIYAESLEAATEIYKSRYPTNA